MTEIIDKTTTAGKILVMQAFDEGKMIESNYVDKPNVEWFSIKNPAWDWANYIYRIKPEPKRVPLEASDIPNPCWLAYAKTTSQNPHMISERLVVRVSHNEIETSGTQHTFKDLFHGGWEYSTDRKNWKLCYKEV